MLSLTRLNAMGKNKNGSHIVEYAFSEKMTGYYLGGKDDIAMMQWQGKGALALGLVGQEVTKEHMTALGDGFAPDGTPLCRNAGEKPKEVTKTDKQGNERVVLEGGHRFGFDLTASSNKYLSTAFALADPEERLRILEVQRSANKRMLEYVEQQVETRRGAQGKEVIGCQGLVVSSHDHLTNRNLDPQLHTHNIIYGVGLGEDGQWGTFEAKEIFRMRHAADMVYQAECARGMEKLGYAIRQDKVMQKGEEINSWAIEGIPEELVKAYSTRREEILDYQDEFNVDAQSATMATRKEKEEPGLDVMTKEWLTRARAVAPELVDNFQQVKSSRVRDEFKSQPDIDNMLRKLHAHEAIATDYDLMVAVGHEYMGQVDSKELFQKVEEFKEHLVPVRPKAIHLDDTSLSAPEKVAREYKETRYQAKWMASTEQAIAHLTKEREKDTHLSLAPETVSTVIAEYEKEKGFTLSDEQKKAIAHVTTDTAGVALLEGFAGTGKTTVAEAYKRAFEREGYTLHGCAISNAASMKLQEESGMECRSVAKTLSMLQKGELELGPKSVLVLDEAGMIGSSHTLALMRFCETQGAKFILQGDENQIQPVDAGSGFTLAKTEAQTAQLTEIRRQAKDEDKRIAELFYDEFHQGLSQGEVKSRAQVLMKGQAIEQALEKRGALMDYNTQNEAVVALVSDYIQNSASLDDKLIITHTHADKRQVNEEVRKQLKAQGALGEVEHRLRCFQNKEFVEQDFAVGDRVRFLAKDASLGVINGTEGIIKDIEEWREGGHSLTVETGAGEVQFNTYEYSALDHNYALTAHKAQGQGKAEVYHLLDSSMEDNQAGLVAFTRLTTGDYTLYGTNDAMEQLKTRLGLDRKKENALVVEKPKVMEAVQKPRKQKTLAESLGPEQPKEAVLKKESQLLR